MYKSIFLDVIGISICSSLSGVMSGANSLSVFPSFYDFKSFKKGTSGHLWLFVIYFLAGTVIGGPFILFLFCTWPASFIVKGKKSLNNSVSFIPLFLHFPLLSSLHSSRLHLSLSSYPSSITLPWAPWFVSSLCLPPRPSLAVTFFPSIYIFLPAPLILVHRFIIHHNASSLLDSYALSSSFPSYLIFPPFLSLSFIIY